MDHSNQGEQMETAQNCVHLTKMRTHFKDMVDILIRTSGWWTLNIGADTTKQWWTL